MGRKSLLRSTKDNSGKPKKTGVQEAERKKAILEWVKQSPDPVKTILTQLALGQSTYYRWLKQYKAKGVDGLNTGGPVSDKVWERFGRLQQREEEQLEARGKLKAEEKQTMKSDKDRERIRKLLFKRFDEKPSGPVAEKEQAAEPEKPKSLDAPSPPSYTSPPEEPMDKALKYAIGAFVLVIAILLASSVSNSGKFYFRQKDQMVEVWRGRFAPMGVVCVASFADSAILEGVPEQESYTKEQAFNAVCNYFIKQADDSLNAGETPDLKGAKSYLAQASKYAVSDSMRRAVRVRLDSINRVRDDIHTHIGGPLAPEKGEMAQPKKQTAH